MKLIQAYKNVIFNEDNILAIVALAAATVMSLLLIITGIAMLLDVLPHVVAIAVILLASLPASIYFLKKHWPK